MFDFNSKWFPFRKWKLHRKNCQLPRETPLPAVSILKPLTGIDPNLFNNLETFFTMNYPKVKKTDFVRSMF